MAVQSATDLENHNTQLTEQHELLVERVNDLVMHSQETNLQITQNIKDNTDSLLKLEKELVAKSIRWRAKLNSVLTILRKKLKVARHAFFNFRRLTMRWKNALHHLRLPQPG